MNKMTKLPLSVLVAFVCTGCAFTPRVSLESEVNKAANDYRQKQSAIDKNQVQEMAIEMAKAMAPRVEFAPKVPEPVGILESKRFDLVANQMPATALFQAIVDKTDLNLVLSNDVSSSVSISLKGVSVKEALDILRKVHGYEYELKGRSLYISKPTILTKTFQVNYLVGTRKGASDTRVTSSSMGEAVSPATTGSSTQGAPSSQGAAPTSKVSTSVNNDFWGTLSDVLTSIVGKVDGAQVVINPQAGLVFVKTSPKIMMEVEDYIKKLENAVSRQVVLEAKIIEVSLKDGAQSGINWTAFDSYANARFSVGANPERLGINGAPLTGTTLGGATGLLTQLAGGALGLTFNTNNFASLISFLETQGNTQVLSTPRIATLNNQKAVLKVGSDEFFVTNISTSTTASGNSTVTSPTISVQPFFSGIALDVTPQIDEEGFVTLHIRPSVSEVFEKNKTINLGSLGTYNLPLASSNINETDSVVRIKTGNIVAIGGLMRAISSSGVSKVPGVGDVPVGGHLFKQKSDSASKSELVILLRPTVIERNAAWPIVDVPSTNR